MLNHEVFHNTQKHSWKILVVTKYWDRERTQNIMSACEQDYPDIFYGLGENRVETLREKHFPRENVHFIGNIQSRKIWEIVKYCSVIHSLASFKHAQKIEALWIPTHAFIQIQLDKSKNIWISASDISEFLASCNTMKYLSIIGISGMGSWEFSEAEKRNELQYLISLRDRYLPHWLISAGTSRDYEIALQEWIDIVRVGHSAISSPSDRENKTLW